MAAPVLATPRPGVRLAASGAAQSFARADAAWQARTGRLIRVNSAYRDYDLQLSMYENWQAYLRGGPKPPHSMALHPDRSKHCLGLAIDTPDWATSGFLTFMAEYGWIQVAPNDPTERHHLEYQSGRDRHRNATVPAGNFEQIREEDMPLNADDVKYLDGLGEAIVQRILNGADANSLRAVRADLGHINDSPKNPKSLTAVADNLAAARAELVQVKADIAHIHQVSPYSLKAISGAVAKAAGVTVSLNARQTAELGAQLTASVVPLLEAALADDFANLTERLKALPAEVRADLKAAL